MHKSKSFIFISFLIIITAAWLGSSSTDEIKSLPQSDKIKYSSLKESHKEIKKNTIIYERVPKAEKIIQVQENIKELSKAFYNKDYKKLLNSTLPKIVEEMGGLLNAEKALKESQGKIDLKLESLDFPVKPVFFTKGKFEYTVVPTLSIVSYQNQRAESLNFQVGRRMKTKNKWYYIEGSRLNKKTLSKFLPNFPVNYKFPKIYRKKL